MKTPERLELLVQNLEISALNITNDQKKQLTQLVSEYSDVFALSNAELGCTNNVCSILLIQGMVNPSSSTRTAPL